MSEIDLRHCDNLELMAEMQDNTVDLIYCDILYGTGKDFGDYLDLHPRRKDIEEHYIPRIKEMHRILKDTGSIYLQMDTKINHWVRCILDDVFGYDNFLNEVIWWYRRFPAKQKNYQAQHDNIILYTKNKKHTYNEQWADKSKKSSKLGKRLIDTGNGTRTTIFTDKETKTRLGNVWEISFLNSQAKERVGYATQKPKELIERIIKASSNEGDLVADFYAGSFTTAEVCQDLKRKFIGCDISERAVEIGLSRIKF